VADSRSTDGDPDPTEPIDPTERIEPGDARRPNRWDDDAADRAARTQATRHVGRRIAVWGIPLLALGVLPTGLGIAWWVSLAVMGIVMAVLVLDIDF